MIYLLTYSEDHLPTNSQKFQWSSNFPAFVNTQDKAKKN